VVNFFEFCLFLTLLSYNVLSEIEKIVNSLFLIEEIASNDIARAELENTCHI
jgi:hypothetical protein